METYANSAYALYKVWAPWILTSLVPSLIVGLSQSPKTKGASTLLKRALGLLSVVTHKDSAGTFKLPFTPDTMINSLSDAAVNAPPPPPTTPDP